MKKVKTAEKVMTSMMEAFLQSQREAEEHLFKYEERREKGERAHVLSWPELVHHAPIQANQH